MVAVGAAIAVWVAVAACGVTVAVAAMIFVAVATIFVAVWVGTVVGGDVGVIDAVG